MKDAKVSSEPGTRASSSGSAQEQKLQQPECEKCGGRLLYSGLNNRLTCEICHDSKPYAANPAA